MRIAAFVLASLIAAPAWAATPQDLSDCNSKYGQEAALACTRVIDDKSSPSEALDQAFFNRALSYETIDLIPEAMSDANEFDPPPAQRRHRLHRPRQGLSGSTGVRALAREFQPGHPTQ